MKGETFVKGLLAGVAIGGSLGVLFAPKSGKETREDIQQAYKQVSADVAKKVSQAKDVTEKTYQEIVDKAVAEYRKLEQLTNEQADELSETLKSRWHDTGK